VTTGSLRVRTGLVTLGILTLALTLFAVLVTVRYRDGLQQDLRRHLLAGAAAMRHAEANQLKPLVATIALEGIATSISPTPTAPRKPGPRRPAPQKPPAVESRGRLLVVTELVGTDRPALATLSASETSVSGSVHRLMIIELIVGIATLGVTIILLLKGLRAALAPLSHVRQTAERIAAGDRSLRLHPRGADSELGRMASSFDAMVDALDGAVERAERSESAMRRFLADASHELRTPIAALHATTETLLREQPPRPERDALEAQLARETTRLGRLVDDLLNLARLEASEPLRRDTVDLSAVARSVVDEMHAHAGGLTLAVHTDDPRIVRGDADALARALRNLLENAAAATLGVGVVTVDVLSADGDAVLRVRDNGPGIAPADRERVFDGFVRLQSSANGGVGLGLAIARRIARAHGGDLICEDIASGASFALRIPSSDFGNTKRP